MIGEVPDDGQLRAVNGQHICAKVRFRPKPSRLPVVKDAISGRSRLGRSSRENPNQDVGAFDEVGCAGNDNGRADLRFDGTLEDADYHVAWLQSRPSDSLASRCRTEAARNSLRSSSDQESDQSILRSGARAARRSIKRDNSMAASGGSLRNALSNDASWEFRRTCMAWTPVYDLPERSITTIRRVGRHRNAIGQAVALARAWECGGGSGRF